MVRYSFLVGLLPPRLHAGLSRRLRSLTLGALIGAPTVREGLLSIAQDHAVRALGWVSQGLAEHYFGQFRAVSVHPLGDIAEWVDGHRAELSEVVFG